MQFLRKPYKRKKIQNNFGNYIKRGVFQCYDPLNTAEKHISQLVMLRFKTLCCLDKFKVKIYLTTVDVTVASNAILYWIAITVKELLKLFEGCLTKNATDRLLLKRVEATLLS